MQWVLKGDEGIAFEFVARRGASERAVEGLILICTVGLCGRDPRDLAVFGLESCMTPFLIFGELFSQLLLVITSC